VSPYGRKEHHDEEDGFLVEEPNRLGISTGIHAPPGVELVLIRQVGDRAIGDLYFVLR
jgi:hypothetical protein